MSTSSDHNAELAVLACCLLSRVALDEAQKHLVESDFDEPAHQVVWRSIVTAHRVDPGYDPASVMTAMTGQPEVTLLPTLLTYPVAVGAVAEHARIVRGWATKRRLWAESLKAQAMALEPGTDAFADAALIAKRFATIRDTGNTDDIQTITLGELLAVEDDEPDWLIPGLLERRDRLILTGQEGLGKSHLLRQIAVMAAAGVHPLWSNRHIDPVRVMIVDCENSENQVRRRIRPMVEVARRWGTHDPAGVGLWCGPRIDITRDRDLARIHFEMDAMQPELVIIGPLYRLTSGAIKDDSDAAPILTALDTIRDRGCALLIEAHAGHAVGAAGKRDMRPRGSSALLGWPEFGYGLRSADHGEVEVVPWRGPRDTRDFPTHLCRASDGTRWLPVDNSNVVRGAWG